MEKTELRREMEPHLEGFAAQLVKEVIRADMSMQEAQLQAWRALIKYRPEGDLINDDIYEGLPKHRYLFLQDVTLSFYATPSSGQSLFGRFKSAWKVLIGKSVTVTQPIQLTVGSADSLNRFEVSVRVGRRENGSFESQIA